MTFTGIPDEALEFYEGLEADNSKAYWTDHKAVYEGSVRSPVEALCEALAPEFGDVHFFRPYRDLRFSKDKSPYKTQQGASVGRHYLQISAAGLFVAVGYYQMASDQVARFREAVASDLSGPDLEHRVASLRDHGYKVSGSMLKTRPRDYPADHPRSELLRHKSLVGSLDFGAPNWLSTPAALDHIATAWRDIAPLQDWLNHHVSRSEEPRR